VDLFALATLATRADEAEDRHLQTSTSYGTTSFIVGNALLGSAQAHSWGDVVGEAVAFPIVFFLHPFMASPDAVAWPFADGTSFIPALVVALIAYPVSTVVGGLDPVDR